MEAIGLPQDNKSKNLGGNTMRKYVEKLVNATNEKVVGNHSVYFHNRQHVCYRADKKGDLKYVEGITRDFYYHGNRICLVNDLEKEFWLSHAGWFTPSTSQVINQYRHYFESLGYKCMTN